MSCCISSAVCCVLVTSSMSGVALGYNYSLAEYIDTKETNVSVYVKRGVFDDDISDDMDWRRRGHPALKGFVRDDGNLKTAAPDEPEQMPLEAERSGRRLEDSILESDSNHRFEGHLMKLTLSPPHPSTTTPGVTSDLEMVQKAHIKVQANLYESINDILPNKNQRKINLQNRLHKAMSPFPQGSLDQLKAIQGIINKRKMSANRDATVRGMSTYNFDQSNLVYGTAAPGKLEEEQQGRRMMHVLGHDISGRRELDGPNIGLRGHTLNPARFAVPDISIGSDLNWMGPKLPPEIYRKFIDPNAIHPATYPSPATYNTGPIRPSPFQLFPTFSSSTPRSVKPDRTPEIARLNEKLSDEKDDIDEKRTEPFMKPLGSVIAKTESSDYYDEESVRGIPVRKKRSIIPVRTKLQPLAKVAAPYQKINPDLLSKFEVIRSVSNEITDYPSILVSKLHFFNKAESNEIPTTEREKSSAKTVKLNINDSTLSVDSSKDSVLWIIHSMFS